MAGEQEHTIAERQFLSNYISHEPAELRVTWVVKREQDGETDELGRHPVEAAGFRRGQWGNDRCAVPSDERNCTFIFIFNFDWCCDVFLSWEQLGSCVPSILPRRS